MVDGICGAKTVEQIELFQQHVLKFQKPDGLVQPEKATHKNLAFTVSNPPDQVQQPGNFYGKSKIDIERFLFLYSQQFQNSYNKAALKNLVVRIFQDAEITDLRWIAYMLATVRRECGAQMTPVTEIGKGRGKDYGNPVTVVDKVTMKEKQNVYYGRGFVQITWDVNYKKVGEKIGMADQLYLNPELALDFETAYKIMSFGMRLGLFTGVGLPKFINGNRCDYVSARKIINGSDHAQEIANNALVFEKLLMASRLKNIYKSITGNEYANYV